MGTARAFVNMLFSGWCFRTSSPDDGDTTVLWIKCPACGKDVGPDTPDDTFVINTLLYLIMSHVCEES